MTDDELKNWEDNLEKNYPIKYFLYWLSIFIGIILFWGGAIFIFCMALIN